MPIIRITLVVLFSLSGINVFADETCLSFTNVYVNDYADVLDNDTRDLITKKLEQLDAETGIEATVVTLNTVRYYTNSNQTFESFVTNLFNCWGVGNVHLNNGILLLAAIDDRKVRIELGSGYAKTYDPVAKKIIDSKILPSFREQDYGKGMTAGVDAIIEQFGSVNWSDVPVNTGQKIQETQSSETETMSVSYKIFALLGGIPIIGAGFYWFRRFRRFHPRECLSCQSQMRLLDEQSEDVHLSNGQNMEEFLKSVDHDVWQCPTCSRVDVLHYKKFFASFSKCPSCGFMTMKVVENILVPATTQQSGVKHVSMNCQHCGEHREYEAAISRIRNSSKSSERKSFGGGKSSGGGASGRW